MTWETMDDDMGDNGWQHGGQWMATWGTMDDNTKVKSKSAKDLCMSMSQPIQVSRQMSRPDEYFTSLWLRVKPKNTEEGR